MSTLPGDDTWRDAGVERPGDSGTPLEELATEGSEPEVPEHEPDEYRPAVPRPDRDGAANEADVVEQAIEVPHEEEGPDAPEL